MSDSTLSHTDHVVSVHCLMISSLINTLHTWTCQFPTPVSTGEKVQKWELGLGSEPRSLVGDSICIELWCYTQPESLTLTNLFIMFQARQQQAELAQQEWLQMQQAAQQAQLAAASASAGQQAGSSLDEDDEDDMWWWRWWPLGPGIWATTRRQGHLHKGTP